MAVGKGFFDQYSVFCVFGSVVGCVVVPLITQSVESVIFSAIVISLTATHLTKRASKSDNSNQSYGGKEMDRRGSRKAKDRGESNGQNKKRKNPTNFLQTSIIRSTDLRKKRECELEKLELARQQELDRKLEEKKEKKVKKKEERMKKKELEKEEKEKEDQRIKKLKEERLKENIRLQEKKQDTLRSRSSTPKPLKKSEHLLHKTTYQPNVPTVMTVTALTRERASSESNDSSPSPPPSVWKVPEYVEPKWNPGNSEKDLNTTKLNNDIIFKKSKLTAPLNQLYNPVHSDQSFCKNQYMNQEKAEPVNDHSYSVLKDIDKPDNRQHGDYYSSFSGLPNILSQMKQTHNEEPKSYSLFGNDQPNSSVFRSPLTGL